MRDVLSRLAQSLDRGLSCVYCAVVETRGSTPQKAGAAMLVFPDGSQVGTLGGGCIEAEVRQRSLRVLGEQGGRAEVLTFHLNDNYGWDDGLICGGRMAILADPLYGTGDGSAVIYHRRYQELVESGQGCIEVVLLRPVDGLPAGARFLVDPEGRPVAARNTGHDPGGVPVLPPAALAGLPSLASRPRAFAQHDIAYLPVLPRITLLIVGGGHVGHAVAQLASQVDFDVWVLDDRERYVSAERFPTASRRIVGDIGVQLRELAPRLDRSCYCLIVTRGHNHDEEALYHLAPTAASYVGMIGSKRKIKLIYEDLLSKGLTEEQLARVHAPLGLPIGSQTVMEIAISIVAELIARRNLGTTEVQARSRIHPDTTRACSSP